MHALIIEQDFWVFLMIEDVLRELDYTSFSFVSSWPAAIAASEARCPDLVTCDIRLGTGQGIATVQGICSGRAIPVVYVTATPWEVREADPAAIVVPKPFCRDSLKIGVRQATIAA